MSAWTVCPSRERRAGSPDCSAMMPPKSAAPSTSLNLRTAPRGDITAEEAKDGHAYPGQACLTPGPRCWQVGLYRGTPFSFDLPFWPASPWFKIQPRSPSSLVIVASALKLFVFWPLDLAQLCTSLVEDSTLPGSCEGVAREPTLVHTVEDTDIFTPGTPVTPFFWTHFIDEETEAQSVTIDDYVLKHKRQRWES